MGHPFYPCPACDGRKGKYITITKVVNGVKKEVKEWKPCPVCGGSGRSHKISKH